jgi:DNA-binding beta-propeller fold protein YncE
MRSITARPTAYRAWPWAIILWVLLSMMGAAPAIAVSPTYRVATATLADLGAAPTPSQAGGYELWVTNQRRNSIQVVRDEVMTAEIALDGVARVPHIFRFSPSGRYAYLASVGMPGNIRSANTTVIRVADRSIVAVLPTGPGTHEASPSPDGERLIVSVGGLKTLAEIVVDEAAESFSIGRQLELGTHPLVMAAGLEAQPVCAHFYAPRQAYVGFHHGGAALLDVSSFELTRVYSKAEVGPNRCAMLPLPDGKLLVGAGTETTGGYAVWDPTTETFVTTIDTTQADNHGGATRPGAAEAWFVARGSDSLTVVSTEAPYGIREIYPFGDAPDHVVFSPDGRWAFVAFRGPEPLTGGPVAAGQMPGLAIVDAETRSIISVVDLGGGDPHWVALRPLP